MIQLQRNTLSEPEGQETRNHRADGTCPFTAPENFPFRKRERERNPGLAFKKLVKYGTQHQKHARVHRGL